MLFNSFSFLFLFLPIVVLVYRMLEPRNREIALGWLTVSSLLFYAWWNPAYLLLLLFSIAFNFLLGTQLQRRPSPWLLGIGVAANLGLLAYYKYAEFLVTTISGLTGADWQIHTIILPLAISFFTFQQIAWLVDAHRGRARESNPLHYCLFVSFFPQLIAGPIVHHAEMMPQFGRERDREKRRRDLEIGATIFCMGFLKKVVLADTAAIHANTVFDAAANGDALTLFEAWGGALAYGFQLYFDFSGYSDMAIGLGRLFGIHLPVNFYSPYKAWNIAEFWRRWHITLTRFLRDYLYIPLGGNRKGPTRTFVNLLITMLLGGLWHGAAWTFVLWGGLHGVYLVINRGWQEIRARLGWKRRSDRTGHVLSVTTTFIAVTLGWVLFRADGFAAATRVYEGMFGFNGVVLPEHLGSALGALGSLGIRFEPTMYLMAWEQWGWLGVLAIIAFGCPNVQQVMARFRAGLMPAHLTLRPGRIQWQARPAWAIGLGLLVAWALLALNRVDEFLYFQF